MASSTAGAREKGHSSSLDQDALACFDQDVLDCIDQNVLACIQHLDLSNNIAVRTREAFAYGGYSEVFTGLLLRDGNEPSVVAVKRLRFHVDEEKVKKARPSLNALKRSSGLTNVVQQFDKEVYVWSKLSHPNILPFLGFAICKETRFPLLISE